LWFALAELYEKQGKLKLALDGYQEALKTSAQQESAYKKYQRNIDVLNKSMAKT